LEVFFDGECPLCLREIKMLRRRDRAQQLSFTDISAPGFSAEARGYSHERLMAEMHARTPEGETLVGVEVFRRIYDSLGFSRLVAISRLWGLRTLLDWGYSVWAKNRLALTGRRCEGVCEV
jgi:predicted DCC family thiol-disulfide oxidoreductase YuxK